MISANEVLMGRDKEFPLDTGLNTNLTMLLEALNKFRTVYNKPMFVSSGYRPGAYNKAAGGAPNSAHALCLACDFHDLDGQLDAWCESNLDVLAKCGLYLENPPQTPGWCHLTVRAPASGHRIFIP